MTNVSFHLTNALPATGEAGGLYFIKDGRLFVAESENNYVEINPIEVVSTLPTQGIPNKIYALEENGNVSLKVWIEGEGYKDTSLPLEDASTTVKGIVQLTNDTNGQSEVLAVTQKGVNDLNTSIREYVDTQDEANATALTEHESVVGTSTVNGHVKLNNTLTHTANDSSALDARQGKALDDKINIHQLTNASTTTKGHVQIGNNITVSEGVISIPEASAQTHGVIKYNETYFTTNENGQLSLRPPQYVVDKYHNYQQMTAGQASVTFPTVSAEATFNSYHWDVYDGGMLVPINDYTLSYSADGLVFTWSIPKQYNTEISLIGVRVVLGQ